MSHMHVPSKIPSWCKLALCTHKIKRCKQTINDVVRAPGREGATSAQDMFPSVYVQHSAVATKVGEALLLRAPLSRSTWPRESRTFVKGEQILSHQPSQLRVKGLLRSSAISPSAGLLACPEGAVARGRRGDRILCHLKTRWPIPAFAVGNGLFPLSQGLNPALKTQTP